MVTFPTIITFPEKVQYTNLTEALTAFQRLAVKRLNDIDWYSGYSNEKYLEFIFYTLMSRACGDLMRIASIYQDSRSSVIAQLLSTYPLFPNDRIDRLSWDIGKTLMKRTIVVCYHQESYHPIWTEQGQGFFNAQWNNSIIDNEASFTEHLKSFYAYDDYRCEVETDLMIQYVRDEMYIPTMIEVYYKYNDDYDITDFLADAVELILSPLIAAAEIIFYSKWSFALSLVLFSFVLLPALETMSFALATEYALNGTAIVDVATGQYLTITSFTAALSTQFSAFLEAIHWSTLVAAHNVALIVSERYREVWADVQTELSRMSEALGLGPHYMNLIIRNTRTLVLDVSTAIGMKYDLAQVQWLSTFGEYSRVLSARAFRYRDNPALIVTDLEELVDRKLADGKASFMSTVVSTVDSTVMAIDNVATTMVTIRNDLEKLARQMPEDMSAFVREYTDPIVEKFDDFMDNTFGPNMANLNTAIQALSIAKEHLRSDLDGTIERLKKPADYLGEIDKLPEDEKADQEEKLQELTTRPYSQNAEEIYNLSRPDSEELTGLQELLEEVREKPSWYVPEDLEPIRTSKEKASPRETWFVGEY